MSRVVSTVTALVRRAVRFEVSLYRSLYRWVRRRHDVPAGAVPFPYVGSVAAILWGFIGVSAVEVVALHLLIPWEPVRLAADIAGIWGLAWMLGLAASFNVYPHLVTGAGLRVRHGHGTDIVIPWDAVATVTSRERTRDGSRTLQVDREEDGVVLHVVVSSRTNVDVSLRRPFRVPTRHGQEEHITALRFLTDEPRALAAAAREHVGRPRRG